MGFVVTRRALQTPAPRSLRNPIRTDGSPDVLRVAAFRGSESLWHKTSDLHVPMAGPRCPARRVWCGVRAHVGPPWRVGRAAGAAPGGAGAPCGLRCAQC
eukprot:6487048-Prymnesium_polylepis.1